MTALRERLTAIIEADGPMPVDRYMAMCLFDPANGYYTTRDPFGRDGDFTTAPEISQMFGELIGAWLVATWRQAGSPHHPVVAEIGPGRGTLMKDILRTLGKLEPKLRQAASFVLIEASDRLAEVQRAAFKDFDGDLTWVASVDQLPSRSLFIVGNELFDAVPARQYVRTAQGWREMCVGLEDDGQLRFVAGVGTLDPGLLPRGSDTVAEGAIFEVSPARWALMEHIADHIAKHGGAGLFLDYGHLEPGFGDTLQAVRRHKPQPPLASPGEADLTTHVDFAALAQAVRSAGLSPHMTTQGDFLLTLGLLERAGALGAKGDHVAREALSQDVERLAGPNGMGGLFKVIGFTSAEQPPPGFPDDIEPASAGPAPLQP